MDKRIIGDVGESLTAQKYREKGFEIIGHNYRIREGEIDVIAKKKNLIVFIEVKTRAKNALFSGVEAVDYKKQKRIIITANSYLQKFSLYDSIVRFDVAEVIIDKAGQADIKCIENAFTV